MNVDEIFDLVARYGGWIVFAGAAILIVFVALGVTRDLRKGRKEAAAAAPETPAEETAAPAFPAAPQQNRKTSLIAAPVSPARPNVPERARSVFGSAAPATLPDSGRRVAGLQGLGLDNGEDEFAAPAEAAPTAGPPRIVAPPNLRSKPKPPVAPPSLRLPPSR